MRSVSASLSRSSSCCTVGAFDATEIQSPVSEKRDRKDRCVPHDAMMDATDMV
jgi:hypothetical protein